MIYFKEGPTGDTSVRVEPRLGSPKTPVEKQLRLREVREGGGRGRTEPRRWMTDFSSTKWQRRRLSTQREEMPPVARLVGCGWLCDEAERKDEPG